jgi:hypothetical protein
MTGLVLCGLALGATVLAIAAREARAARLPIRVRAGRPMRQPRR